MKSWLTLAAFSQSASGVVTVRLTGRIKTGSCQICLLKCGSGSSFIWPPLVNNTIAVYGSPAKGIWKEDSLAGDPGRELERVLDTGISFHRDPAGDPGKGLSTRDFERWMKALGMERFCL